MAERRLHGLQRVLGTNALFATAYGNVGSSIYYALGLVAAYALGLTPVIFIITGFFFFCTAASYAEATAMYPEAGGSSSFARRAFNELWSFLAAWGGMLTYTMTVATSAFFVPQYLSRAAWPWLGTPVGSVVGAVVVVALLALVNIVGAQESTRVNVLFALLDFATQLVIVVLGFVLVLSPRTLLDGLSLFGTAPTLTQFALAIPIGMLAYTGIETISNMAEEAKDETRSIPKSIARVQIAVFAIYFTLPAVALSALPVKTATAGTLPVTSGAVEVGERYTPLGLSREQGGYAGDPILGVVEAMGLGPLERPATVFVALLAATILTLATNAGLIGVSRLVYSMGVHRQLPDALRRLHPKFGTPWLGILIFAGLAILAILPGQATFLASLYSFGALLSFTIANVAVIRLRKLVPDQPRPFRGPWNVNIRGYDAPIFAIIGAVACGSAFLVIALLNPLTGLVGTAWLAIGAVFYVIFRRREGLDLTSTHRVAIPQAVTDHEAEYDSVLVAFSTDDGFDERLLATAKTLAARRRHGVHVLVVVPVPHNLPIDAPRPEAEAIAGSILEQARLSGGRRVTGHWEKARPGQAGRRIIEEAQDMRASAIVLGLPRRVAGASLFGKTLETVLSERPCRIIIESSPAVGQRRGIETAAARAEVV